MDNIHTIITVYKHQQLKCAFIKRHYNYANNAIIEDRIRSVLMVAH